MATSRVRLQIRGIVQGVSYRASTADQAKRLGLVGWVRNLRDGSVEAMAQGEAERVERFVEWCRVGPQEARVTSVDAEAQPVNDDLLGFRIT